MNNLKGFFVLLFLLIFATNSFARYGFDRMRCNGNLIEEGSSYEKVIELCGAPIEERNWGNQYMTKKWYVFKSDIGSATYYMYFEDGHLLESRMQP